MSELEPVSVEQVKTHRHHKRRHHRQSGWSQLETDYNCQICFQVFLDPVSLPCGHSYCGGCLTRLISKRKHSAGEQQECPTCRAEFDSHTKFTTNILLRNTLESLGGEKYRNYVQKRSKEETYELMEDKYKTSRRFKKTQADLYNLLDNQPGINYSELKDTKLKCPEIELKYNLKHMLNKKRLFQVNDKFVLKDQIYTYLNCQVDQLENDEIVYLLGSMSRKLNSKVKNKIMNGSTLSVSDQEIKVSRHKWEDHLKKINVDLIADQSSRCGGCGDYHDFDDDEDEDEGYYSEEDDEPGSQFEFDSVSDYTYSGEGEESNE